MARPSLPPDTADIDGRVVDASSRAPVAGATVRLVPFNVVMTSATDGSFAAHGLSVTGRCRWLTIEVDAPGYGRLVTVDNPLYQSRSYVELQVRADEQRRYMGPPRAEAHLGEAFCSR